MRSGTRQAIGVLLSICVGLSANPVGAQLIVVTRGADGGATQAIFIDRAVTAGAYTLFPTVDDPNEYYYVPRTASLAIENGRPKFSFVRYVKNRKTEAGAEEAAQPLVDGIVHAVVQLGVPESQREEALREAERALKDFNPAGKIVAAATFSEGELALVTQFQPQEGPTGSGEGELPALATAVVGTGTAPVLEGARAPISIRLTEAGVERLWESFNTDTADLSFSFKMKLDGFRTPVRAKLVADWDQIYDHQRFQAGISAPMTQAQIDVAFDELKQSGAIQITQVGTDAKVEELIDETYDKLRDLMFNPSTGLVAAGRTQMAAASTGGDDLMTAAEKLRDDRRSERLAAATRAKTEATEARNLATQAEQNAQAARSCIQTVTAFANRQAGEEREKADLEQLTERHRRLVEDYEATKSTLDSAASEQKLRQIAAVAAQIRTQGGTVTQTPSLLSASPTAPPSPPAPGLTASPTPPQRTASPTPPTPTPPQRTASPTPPTPAPPQRTASPTPPAPTPPQRAASPTPAGVKPPTPATNGSGSGPAGDATPPAGGSGPDDVVTLPPVRISANPPANGPAGAAPPSPSSGSGGTPPSGNSTSPPRNADGTPAPRGIDDESADLSTDVATRTPPRRTRRQASPPAGNTTGPNSGSRTSQTASTSGTRRNTTATGTTRQRPATTSTRPTPTRPTSTRPTATTPGRRPTTSSASTRPSAATTIGAFSCPTQTQLADTPAAELASWVSYVQGEGTRYETIASEQRARANSLQEEADDARESAASVEDATAVVAKFEMKKQRHQFKFQLDFNKSRETRIPVDFGVNIGSLRRYLDDDRVFRSVNLDDAFLKQRELAVFVDMKQLDDFKEYINFVTVQLRKTHESGEVTRDEIRIDRTNAEASDNQFSLLYGWKGDDDRDAWQGYEWRALWSFFGGNSVEGEWQPATASAIAVLPPYERTYVDVDADPDSWDERGVRAAVVDVYYDLAGKTNRKRTTLRSPDLASRVHFMLPKGASDFDYEVRWMASGGRGYQTGRRTSNFPLLFVSDLLTDELEASDD